MLFFKKKKTETESDQLNYTSRSLVKVWQAARIFGVPLNTYRNSLKRLGTTAKGGDIITFGTAVQAAIATQKGQATVLNFLELGVLEINYNGTDYGL